MRGDAPLFRNQSPGDPVLDLGAGIFQIPMLVSGTLAGEHQPSGPVQPAGHEFKKPVAASVIQALNSRKIHAQLNLGCHLIHVLPSGTGGPHSPELESITGNDDSICDYYGRRHSVFFAAMKLSG